jgi:hypothetical protein
MAATNFTPISLYYSATAASVPTAGNLVAGELALNTADGRLFYKDSAGVVQTLASKSTGTIGGSTTQVQYNSSGSFAGSANMTFNGTTLTLANDASISGLTVGKGGGAGSTNTAVGLNALATNASATQITAVGWNAANLTTVGGVTAIGSRSLATNSTGANNSALGTEALFSNTTGSQNTALGNSALTSNTTASNNTAVGYQAGYSNTTGTQNVIVGGGAGYNLTSSYNCLVGYGAGAALTSGSGNTFVGGAPNLPSGYYVTTGSKNTILGGYNGNQGGLDIRTASNYIVLSDGDGNPRIACNSSGDFFTAGATESGTSSTGFKATNSASLPNIQIVGNTSTAPNTLLIYNQNATNNGNRFYVNINGGIYNYSGNNSNLSDERTKTNINLASNYLDKICAIPVKTFNYKDEPTGEQKTLGVIAQDVEIIAPELVNNKGFGETKEGEQPLKSIYTTDMMFAMMKAIQELKAEVDALKQQLNGA